MVVSEREVSQYLPTEMDCRIATGLLAGACTGEALAEYVKAPYEDVALVLKNPVSMAWISRQITAQVENSLGVVIAAMYRQACAGDVSAAKLILENYKKLPDVRHVVHHSGLDLQKLSDDELDLVLKEKIHAAEVVSVRQGDADSGDGGEAEAGSGSTVSEVQTEQSA